MFASKQEIQQRLLVWLKAQDFEVTFGEQQTVYIRLQAKIGNWQCRIIIEDSFPPLGNPANITLISRMPISIPESRIADTAVMLHSLNRYIGIGHLAMDSKERYAYYRITLTIEGGSVFEKTFEYALRQSVFYMEEHIGFLCFFCFNSEFNHRRANYHLKASDLGESKFLYPGNYDEFHSDWVVGRKRMGEGDEFSND